MFFIQVFYAFPDGFGLFFISGNSKKSFAGLADKNAWEKREECYEKELAFEQKNDPSSDWKPNYLLDPNDGRYTQSKFMEKFILNKV